MDGANQGMLNSWCAQQQYHWSRAQSSVQMFQAALRVCALHLENSKAAPTTTNNMPAAELRGSSEESKGSLEHDNERKRIL